MADLFSSVDLERHKEGGGAAIFPPLPPSGLNPLVDGLLIAYHIARGGAEPFENRSTRQLYWKGRCEAANEIRARLHKEVERWEAALSTVTSDTHK